MRERRRNLRFNLNGRLTLEIDGKTMVFTVADISISGVGILLDSPVFGMKPAGKVGYCHIESQDLAAPVEAFVSLMRVSHVGRNYLLGLRFESINDEQLRVLHAYEALARARQNRMMAAQRAAR